MYEYYTVAKKALAKGSAVCQNAHVLAKDIEAGLESAATVAAQLTYLRSSLQTQLSTLHKISDQVRKEEEGSKAEFNEILRELDLLDGQLNKALKNLQSTNIPAILDSTEDTKSGTADLFSTKTLFEFADDAAVETLKGQLRQIIDDMQEFQEGLATLGTKHINNVRELEKSYSALPESPALRAPGETANMTMNKEAPSMSIVTSGFAKQQEEHLHEMAELLVQLSQHYDHSCTLFKSVSTLPMDELEELQSIVEHDAEQLEDVLTELDERTVDLEEDLAIVRDHVNECYKLQSSMLNVFEKFEVFDVNGTASQLSSLLRHKTTTLDQLDILKQQLVGLAGHYEAFDLSYNALLIEIDRRSKYESTVATFIEQTKQTLARLAIDECGKRDQFIRDHGASLPGDIWHGISDLPVHIAFEPTEDPFSTPRLPQSLLVAAHRRLDDL